MALKNIKREPISGMGGLKYVLVADFADVKVDMTNFLTTGIAAITLADGTAITDKTNPFVKIEMNKKSGIAGYAYTGDAANGSGENVQTVTMSFGNAGKNAEKTVAIQALLNIYSLVIPVDMNGQAVIYGATDGCDTTGGAGGTGQSGTDKNGHDITFTGTEPQLAPSIDDATLAIISVPLT